jgi:glycosyltransferase involved in cell wall biosynthesis
LVILSVHNTSDIYGASQSLLRMLRRLRLDGHSVHVVLCAPGPLLELLESDGVAVHIFESLAIVERTLLGSFLGKLLFCARYVYSVTWLSLLVLRLGVDVVHTNTAVMPAPALAAWLTRRRHLWHLREFFVEFPSIWKYYQRYIWRFSERIITISNAVRDQFEPDFRSKCVTLYNSLGQGAADVDLCAAQRFRKSVGDPPMLIGVIGRIKWVRKGQEILIKAAALLADQYPDARYAIVGSVAAGNEDHLLRLKELIRELRLEDKVVFTGDIRNTRDVYAAFDITAVPSVLPEPFGRVVMESMAAGTPVIGSRCGGIPEQMVDGETGLLFEPGDDRELAAAISKLMADDELRARMGKAARDRALSLFDDSVTYASAARVFATDKNTADKRIREY